MFDWLRRNKPQPLAGAPAIQREKTYSAESGCVYSYFYRGHRPCRGGAAYVFDVSADRRGVVPVSVFLSGAAIEPWQTAHGRELTGSERYAIAKLALLAAFDQRQDLSFMREQIHVQPADAASILETLGID
jgi:hypothetical protein